MKYEIRAESGGNSGKMVTKDLAFAVKSLASKSARLYAKVVN